MYESCARVYALLLHSDNPAARVLKADAFTDAAAMTVEACISFCDAKSFIYAGVEFAQECCTLPIFFCRSARHLNLPDLMSRLRQSFRRWHGC
jgi:hypothetical protein